MRLDMDLSLAGPCLAPGATLAYEAHWQGWSDVSTRQVSDAVSRS